MAVDLHSRFVFDQFLGLADLGERAAFLVSVAALVRGGEVRFFRSQNEAGIRIASFPPKFKSAQLYSVKVGPKQHFFNASAGDNVSFQTAAATQDKIRTKLALSQAGIATPFGGLVHAGEMQVFDKLAEKGVTHVALKPVIGSLGRGVLLNLPIDSARQEVLRHPTRRYLAEQMISGAEFRIMVVGGKVVAAHRFVPQNVVGDGENTIRALIKAATEARKRNPAYFDVPFNGREIIKRIILAKENLDRVPAKGEFVLLTTSPLAKNSDRVPCHDILPKAFTDVCLRAAKVLGSNNCGLDVMLTRRDEIFVFEANTRPGLANQCFPHPTGKWNLDVPNAILDLFFPNHQSKDRDVLSYDFAALKAELLREGRTSKGVNAADFATFA